MPSFSSLSFAFCISASVGLSGVSEARSGSSFTRSIDAR